MDRLFALLVKNREFVSLTFCCLRRGSISLMLIKGIPAEQITTWAGYLDVKLTATIWKRSPKNEPEVH